MYVYFCKDMSISKERSCLSIIETVHPTPIQNNLQKFLRFDKIRFSSHFYGELFERTVYPNTPPYISEYITSKQTNRKLCLL